MPEAAASADPLNRPCKEIMLICPPVGAWSSPGSIGRKRIARDPESPMRGVTTSVDSSRAHYHVALVFK